MTFPWLDFGGYADDLPFRELGAIGHGPKLLGSIDTSALDWAYVGLDHLKVHSTGLMLRVVALAQGVHAEAAIRRGDHAPELMLVEPEAGEFSHVGGEAGSSDAQDDEPAHLHSTTDLWCHLRPLPSAVTVRVAWKSAGLPPIAHTFALGSGQPAVVHLGPPQDVV